MNTPKTENPSFATRPHVLPDVVRNVVIARATAGAYDPSETSAKAIEACRADARRRLGQKRLNPAQADEVDALTLATRECALQNRNYCFPPATPFALAPNASGSSNAMVPAAEGQTSTAMATASSFDNETGSKILAAIERLEKLFLMIITLIMKRGGSSTSDATGASTMPHFNEPHPADYGLPAGSSALAIDASRPVQIIEGASNGATNAEAWRVVEMPAPRPAPRPAASIPSRMFATQAMPAYAPALPAYAHQAHELPALPPANGSRALALRKPS